jgi:hypothetical protein
VQGYNAQAVVTEQQIVIAAEVNIDPQDFSHLGPMVTAARAELQQAGVTDPVGVVLADAGYWHYQQMDELAAQGIPVLIPPDSSNARQPGPGGTADATPGCGACSPPIWGASSTANDGRSSRCSDRSNTTGGSIASNDEAGRPCGLNGD